MKTGQTDMRFDLKVIASWIDPGTSVLDLGCGEGDLLELLRQEKGVSGTGIEQDEARAAACIQKGLSVLQGDINTEILDYPDASFDYVVLSQTLQQVYDPPEIIRAMLRVGKKGIVSFPNFSHWRVRLQLFFKGYAPRTKQLPYEWFNTPNIRVITIEDFRKFARDMGFAIQKEVCISTDHRDTRGEIVVRLPNFRATYGMFLISTRS